jgi:pyruvate kinase
MPALTDIDKKDIKFGVENDVEYIAASFIRKKQDVLEIKKYLNKLKADNIKVISKIESEEGINNFDEILEVSDGIMVARGDMGVEVKIDTLPVIQKNIIKKTIKAGKLVITATQMLESMIVCPRPTRAEVSDVANAVYDSTSAIMLSGETANGSYPLECIDMMNDIAETTENAIDYWNRFKKRNVDKMGAYVTETEDKCTDETVSFRRQINFSVCSSAMFVKAKAILSISESGKTPAVISGYRPACPIYVFTANKKTYLQLSLEWGIHAVYIENEYNFEDILKKGIDKIVKDGILQKGDIVMLAGGASKDYTNGNNISTQTMGALIKV